MSYLWKNSKVKWYMKKHLQTKHNIFFWFQVRDNKISDIFYKIQKFLRTSWAPIITTNGINFLIARPLITEQCCQTETQTNKSENQTLSDHISTKNQTKSGPKLAILRSKSDLFLKPNSDIRQIDFYLKIFCI
jgi:hypothetical protein